MAAAQKQGGGFSHALEASVPELDLNALLTASQAARYAGVTRSAITKWRIRGHLPVATDEHGSEIRDDHGRPKFRLLDVAKAERATAKAARRFPVAA